MFRNIRSKLRDETDPPGIPAFITRCTAVREGHLVNDRDWLALYTTMRNFQLCKEANARAK